MYIYILLFDVSYYNKIKWTLEIMGMDNVKIFMKFHALAINQKMNRWV